MTEAPEPYRFEPRKDTWAAKAAEELGVSHGKFIRVIDRLLPKQQTCASVKPLIFHLRNDGVYCSGLYKITPREADNWRVKYANRTIRDLCPDLNTALDWVNGYHHDQITEALNIRTEAEVRREATGEALDLLLWAKNKKDAVDKIHALIEGE